MAREGAEDEPMFKRPGSRPIPRGVVFISSGGTMSIARKYVLTFGTVAALAVALIAA